MTDFKIRKFADQDKTAVVNLLNQAYREESSSWTTEYGLVNGARINEQQLDSFTGDIRNHFYVMEQACLNGATVSIIGCIGITELHQAVEIGTFCVKPNRQNSGLGKVLLEFAERTVLNEFDAINEFQMYVLDVRAELIEYYARRGYVQTGIAEEYPVHADVGVPLQSIMLLQLKKTVEK
ncbi:GNAT family N-acetyltransferase [Acinetobacter chinensis]|uniref:GNAT family N-acetyltransferase n=1 Tax=Acinetobacter chinensis TaxID=2004650 RepID=A0ABU3WCV6_9GAMM|nr:GNAT family N-acetyltransferase [Acinetobacter chinensis]MDV2468243.1 GNAT family N-acetyltransferase [Acinetobacter chinensis]